MRIAIAGGSGFIGRALTSLLLDAGHQVTWLSHRLGRAAAFDSRVREEPFRPEAADDPWAHAIAESDAVVNLSGYPIASRWNDRVKHELRSSRVDLTRAISECVARSRATGSGPTVLVNASAVGIYGECGESLVTEQAPTGGDFLADIAVEWEGATSPATESGARVVCIRTGLVLGSEGLLPRLEIPMRFFVGGPVGSGRQWMSWIHHDDIARLYLHALENDTASGPLNGGAPSPVRSRELSAAIGRTVGRPSWLPVPEAGLRVVLGEVAPYMLKSQRMDAARVLSTGFEFRYPEVGEALADLVDRG